MALTPVPGVEKPTPNRLAPEASGLRDWPAHSASGLVIAVMLPCGSHAPVG
ncbi:hypothetical protein BJ999_003431 [Actinomadura citrea]|uniref:Uncharacterized protein n=1 Tax=Actinomadura citrea TaxID=46158 RepID=A0A7Y9KD78_9ACTN|nr:hypothetical protein [Actinomadura citrea]